MSNGLSPHNQEYLDRVVAGGLYPSREAALDAAVAALREKNDDIPFVPPEHMELVEEALASAAAGLSKPMTGEDWASLRQLVADIAKKNSERNGV